MHNSHDPRVLPMRDGVSPSCVALPASAGGLLLDLLAEHLPAVDRAAWAARMLAGDVVDEFGVRATPAHPAQPGVRIYYYRALEAEAEIPFAESIVYQDEHILVADKPHFLPVVPSGRYLQNTLLVRLKRRLQLPDLAPMHRIDRDTCGLVLFSVERSTRGRYQALFRDRAVSKTYEAIAPWRADLAFPRVHQSCMQESAQFFRMHEVPGPPNTCTHMELIERQGAWARYRLSPVTGKRHQLRVHMASLGLPLDGDPLYPVVNDPPEGDYSNPLQLLARSLEFDDPVTGEKRRFDSGLSLRQLAQLQ
ncbi:MAG: pseudouridine synthase [Comamonadaceae bacterium]|nr:MAG: pseudouridine synthase [Comamonadaceae bacterium]